MLRAVPVTVTIIVVIYELINCAGFLSKYLYVSNVKSLGNSEIPYVTMLFSELSETDTTERNGIKQTNIRTANMTVVTTSGKRLFTSLPAFLKTAHSCCYTC